MTIRKGEDWGTTATLLPDDPVVASDHELSSLFTIIDGAVRGPERVGVVGGDLARTVGARADREEIRSGERVALPIDLGVVTIDGREVVMASSLLIKRPFWSGEVDAAMNASFYGAWNVTPSGHPNDGRFDVVHAALSWSDRWKARSRMVTGSHVPHPDITIRRLKSSEFTPHVRARVWLDGVCIGSASHVKFSVCADATFVLI